jgi:hypothetical protein
MASGRNHEAGQPPDWIGRLGCFRVGLPPASLDQCIITNAPLGFSGVAIAKGQPDHAATLLGVIDFLLVTLGFRLDPADDDEYNDYVDAARTGLGDTAFAAAWAEGRAMTLEQAIEYALAAEPPVKS